MKREGRISAAARASSSAWRNENARPSAIVLESSCSTCQRKRGSAGTAGAAPRSSTVSSRTRPCATRCAMTRDSSS